MIFADALSWLVDPDNWSGPNSIPYLTAVHMLYCVLSVAGAAIIAIPAGFYVGHTGKGGFLLIGTSNSVRALPTLGLITFLYLVVGTGQIGVLIALIVLAIPPILAGVYAGVQNVDAAAVDAARGMGMTGMQQLWQVEAPNAAPLLMGGLRNATLQVVATASVAAYVGVSTLGRPLLDGLRVLNYGQFIGGAILIALLALVVDLVLSILGTLVIPKGLRQPTRRERRIKPVVTRSGGSGA